MSDSDFTIPISHTHDSSSEVGEERGYKILRSGDLLWKRYYIVRELGSGGFATTYLAVDRQSKPQTKCVVKQLQPRFNSPAVWANAKERLATEANVLQWLGTHDRIPRLLAHFEEDRQFYLVLEFIEGEELELEVQRQVLTEPQVVEFLIEILKILNFVHQQAVIHRDIKPTNLIRRKKDGKFTLIDFGAVKEIGTLAFDSNKQPIETQIIGTPGYMPPEQNSGKPIFSSDLYALGKTAIFALTGRSPIEWEFSESPDSPNWYDNLTISKALIEVIERLTASKIAERYHNANRVLQDLKPMLAVGKTVAGRYYIDEYIGSRGRISTYISRNLGADNPSLYYLKILQPQQTPASSLDFVIERLNRELTELTKLETCSQVPKIIEYLTDRKNLYLIQEYIEGESLARIIKRKKIFSEAEIIDIVISTAKILVSIHQQNIIHGNINPLSIIKRKHDGKLLLVDFGSIQEAISLSSNSHSQVFPGSQSHTDEPHEAKHLSYPASSSNLERAEYLSPEQIFGSKSVASDIYSLGMTAIHLLTGVAPANLPKNPRTGEILWQDFQAASESKNEVIYNAKLAKILNKMVCLDKRKRYHSAAKLIKDLNKIKHSSSFHNLSKYLSIVLVLTGVVWFGLIQWAQRVAILEFYKGDIKLEAKKYREAIEYYDNGLQKLPKTYGIVKNFEQVWLKKARALSQLNSYEQVIDTCSNALRYYQSYRLWNCKALALDSLKQYEEALKSYDRALGLNNDSPWVWNNRGEVYAKMGNPEAAISDFKQAIELDAERSFVPWNNLGKLHYQQQDYQRAIEAYQQALSVKEDYLPALIGLGNAQKNLQQYSEALQAYNKAIEIDDTSYEAWYGKGLVEESLQQYREARKAYQKAFSLKPDWETVIKALQRVERKLGN